MRMPKRFGLVIWYETEALSIDPNKDSTNAGAEAVVGSHDFDSIVIVYYPSLEFFADKQVGDVQATITAPILGHL